MTLKWIPARLQMEPGASLPNLLSAQRRGQVSILFVAEPQFRDAWVSLQSQDNNVVVEPDGRMLLVLTFYQPSFRRQLVRLLSNGARDPSFKELLSTNDDFSILRPGIVIQPDGRYLAAGRLANLNGATNRTIVRLHLDGTVDVSFLPKWPQLSAPHRKLNVTALAVQPDGKILAGWNSYTTTNNPPRFDRAGLVRLHIDGSQDITFDAGSGPLTPWPSEGVRSPAFVNRIVVQPDGQILVAGEFTDFGGFPRPHLVRLNGDGRALRLGTPTVAADGTVMLPLSPGVYATSPIVIEIATRLSPADWQPAFTNAPGAAPMKLTMPAGGNSSQRFYRALAR